ncbi:copper chaperone PCu(A)C [Pseudomonadota bacterium]
MKIKTLITTTALATALMASSAMADVIASKAWARGSAGMAKAGGAFMMLKNDGHGDDALIAAKSSVSDRIEMHTHTMVDGVMKMREVEGGIPVPGMGTQMLQPGGFHVMFMNLEAPLKEGSTFPLTLIFKSGQETTIDVKVMAPNAMGGAMGAAKEHGGSAAPAKEHGGTAAPAKGGMQGH